MTRKCPDFPLKRNNWTSCVFPGAGEGGLRVGSSRGRPSERQNCPGTHDNRSSPLVFMCTSKISIFTNVHYNILSPLR